MTYLLDSSAALADIFGEPGTDRVRQLVDDPLTVVGISVLTLYEAYTAVLHRTGSEEQSREAVAILRAAMHEVVPVTEEIVDLAMELRQAATARIATADCIIGATAAYHGATLVHRDPHFAALPAGRLAQETLPDKA